jgi:hypothetical protein
VTVAIELILKQSQHVLAAETTGRQRDAVNHYKLDTSRESSPIAVAGWHPSDAGKPMVVFDVQGAALKG